MSIFEYANYRDFLKEHIAKLTMRGHGELSKISKHLGAAIRLYTSTAERGRSIEETIQRFGLSRQKTLEILQSL